MPKIETLNVDLTSEMAAAVRKAVEDGEYASASEVIREALREWKQHRTDREQAIEKLGRLWDEGINSGPAIEADEVWEELTTRVANAAGGNK
jgi:antitoxin ParD1/3/4